MAANKRAAEEFAKYWLSRGDEKSETQKYWIDLLQNVLGIGDALHRLRFEERIDTEAGSSKGFADVCIMKPACDDVLAMVEQKSANVDLDKPEMRQGRMVTPVQQCRAYAEALPLNKQPRWVITCNFVTLRVYDRYSDPLCMKPPVVALSLSELPANLDALSFLTGGVATPVLSHAVSIKAGELMARVHDMLAASFAQVMDPDDPAVHHALSVICTRLMFLMFCEDAGLLSANVFRNFLRETKPERLRKALADLFVWLDTPDAERDPFDVKDGPFKDFPYMNGGLFAERVQIPTIDETLRHTLIVNGCQEFDWSAVSPTVFGSIFEGALSHDKRRSGGMHYTSPENIHKLIDPLFLDGLKAEFEHAMERSGGQRMRELHELHDKLGSLVFFDPACGSGNFLTETYIELRRLETRILVELERDANRRFIFEDLGESPVKVSLVNFRGIEINDFACCVARTALWIAEKQADIELEKMLGKLVNDPLPLTDYRCIMEGNALRMDWNDVVPADECSYVMGNPPFIGARFQTKEQKREVLDVFDGAKNAGNIDYCGAWYMKAARYTQGTHARCAFVSTNSICQGEQVANLWRPIYGLDVHIDFAHNTFRWDSEATDEAHVFCVIVGFSREGGKKTLFYHSTPDVSEEVCEVERLNAYLKDAPDVFIYSRSKPLCDVPAMGIGSQPIDDGNYLFTAEEKAELLSKEPAAVCFFHPWLGSQEFIRGKERWVLWLGKASWTDLRNLPECRKRIEAVRDFRLGSKRSQTLKAAESPAHFGTEIIPNAPAILIPKVSSSRRRYIPMGFIGPETLCSDLVFLVPDATPYHFGVLQSQFHNAWVRVVCGRLKDDYRYSASIVYNNFVWPDPSDAQRADIERCAQAVFDARKAQKDATLADMYDPKNECFFPELMAAHRELDAAVEAAYGVDFAGDEEKIVAHLFNLYAERTAH